SELISIVSSLWSTGVMSFLGDSDDFSRICRIILLIIFSSVKSTITVSEWCIVASCTIRLMVIPNTSACNPPRTSALSFAYNFSKYSPNFING
ncbi:hypothetical protein L9F63_019211, partial [Diploptera punctata]